MTALREVLAKFSFNADTAAVVKANTAVDSLVGSLGGISGLLGAGLAGLGLGVFKNSADELATKSEELEKAAIKSGLGFEEFQRLSFTSGVSAEKLTGIFRKLQQTTAAAGGKATDAAGGFDDLDQSLGHTLSKGDAGKLFKDLKITLGEDVGENFDNIVHKLSQVGDQSKRTALATKIFGRAGQDLLPFLERTPEELQEMSDAFQAFGGITERQKKVLKDYKRQSEILDLAMHALGAEVITKLVPAMTAFVKALSGVGGWVKKTINTDQLLVSGLVVLGGAFLVLKGQAIASAVATAASWAATAAPFIALGLLLDDLIHFIKGDATTATGRLFTLFFGKAGSDSIAADMKRDIEAYTNAIQNAKGPTDTLLATFGGIGKAIASVFTQTLPDAWTVFWDEMNEGISGQTGTFSDFVSDTFTKIGALIIESMIEGYEQLLGETASKFLGLDKKHEEISNYIASEGQKIQDRKDAKEANLAFNQGGGYGQNAQSAQAGVSFGLVPGGANAGLWNSPKLGDTVPGFGAPVNQSNTTNITMNVAATQADPGDIANQTLEIMNRVNKQALDALAKQAKKK